MHRKMGLAGREGNSRPRPACPGGALTGQLEVIRPVQRLRPGLPQWF
jgi:hypothetical protein